MFSAQTSCSDVGSYKKLGGQVVMWGAQNAPLAEIGLTDLSKSGGSILPPPPVSDGSAGQGDGHPAANFLPTKDHGIRLESSMAPAYLAYTFRNLSSDFLEPQNCDLKTEEIAKNLMSVSKL